MGTLKDTLTADMRTALKARDEVTTSTLRMALAAVGNAEVAGDSKRQLSDEEVLAVLAKEAKKRREAAEAFTKAGRTEMAQREELEGEVLARYLPVQLGDAELTAIAREAVDEVAGQLGQRPGQRQMGQVMKLATAKVAGRAEGSRVAGAVRKLLQS
jgi:uncharacterized protein